MRRPRPPWGCISANERENTIQDKTWPSIKTDYTNKDMGVGHIYGCAPPHHNDYNMIASGYCRFPLQGVQPGAAYGAYRPYGMMALGTATGRDPVGYCPSYAAHGQLETTACPLRGAAQKVPLPQKQRQ